jgi:hypothetical protein
MNASTQRLGACDSDGGAVMGRSRLSFGSLLLLACSSSSATALPTKCNQSDRHGTYLVHLETVSGSCGPVPDSLISTAVAPSCMVTSEMWSDQNCQVDRTLWCARADSTVTTITETTRQQTQDGSVIKGGATFSTSGPSGSCLGTYNLTYTRQ